MVASQSHAGVEFVIARMTFGRRLELISVPGGETTDSLVVWLPDERTVFTGNLFGPLFGHVPNLVTMRGDRYRDPLEYIRSIELVLALAPERLITGHFQPIEGADRIAEEIGAMRDAMHAVHDQVLDGMNAGSDVLCSACTASLTRYWMSSANPSAAR